MATRRTSARPPSKPRPRTASAPKRRAAAAAPAPAPAAVPSARGRVVTRIDVDLVLNAKNGLRRVIFGLSKDTQGDVVTWTIDFQLFERAVRSEAYTDPLVSLQVEVDTALNAKAEAAANQGLTPGQALHALGPAANDAKAAQAGEIDAEEAEATVQATLKKK